MKPALLALLFFCTIRSFGEEIFYTSNASGMLLQRVSAYRRDETEWIVSVNKSAAAETRRLLDNGVESRRWETTWSSTQKVERELVGDVLQYRRVYDAGGALLQEEQYKSGELSQKSIFTYSAGRLMRMRAVDGAGAQIYAEEYLYATNGSLRQVVRTGSPGEVTSSSFVAGPAGLSEERVHGVDANYVVRYDVQGRVEDREERRGTALVSREDFTYQGDGDALAHSTLSLPADSTVVERTYDDGGLLATETTTTKGAVVLQDTYTRDEKGQVTVKVRRGPLGIESWKYTRDDAGVVKREQYSLRGSIVKVTLYGEKSQRVEELYANGEVVLKVYYDGDTRLKEQVYKGGVLLRERTFP